MPDIYFPHLGIEFNTINRTIGIFGLSIAWYAVFVVLGIIAGVYMGAVFAPKQTKQNHELYTDYALIAVPSCILGARLFYVAFNWGSFSHNPLLIFAVWQGGLAIYGVIIAAIVSSFIFCRVKKLNWLNFADTGIVGLVIGHAIGRFGNFVNREAFGRYTDTLFAMRVRLDQVWSQAAITDEMRNNATEIHGIQYIQVHPTFLYEVVVLLLLFVFLNIYRTKKKFNGELLAYYFVVYGTARSFIEILRTDQLLAGGLPVSFLMSVAMAAVGLIYLVLNFVKLRMNKVA